MTEFTFKNTFGMGLEGFSRPVNIAKMHPVSGNRGEFLFIFAFIVTVPLLIRGRKSNEKSLRSLTNSTNRYAELTLDDESRKPSKWTL